MPLLEGEHRAPIEPEVRVEEVLAKPLVDAHVLHLRAGGEEELDQLLLGLLAQGELAVGVPVLTSILGGALQRVVRVVLVRPVELVEDAPALDFQGGHRAEQVPQALEVVLHLAPTTDDEAVLRLLDPVKAAAGDVVLLEDVEVLPRDLRVAHEKRGRGQPRQARSQDPGGLLPPRRACGGGRKLRSCRLCSACRYSFRWRGCYGGNARSAETGHTPEMIENTPYGGWCGTVWRRSPGLNIFYR